MSLQKVTGIDVLEYVLNANLIQGVSFQKFIYRVLETTLLQH